MLKQHDLPHSRRRTVRFLAGAAFAALLGLAGIAQAEVTFSIGDPRFYGRIDIGGRPPPPVIYADPIVVTPSHVVGPPIYMRVPHRHARHWRRHCRDYGACGEPVFFVRDSWYQREFAPRYMGYEVSPPPHFRHREDWRGRHMYDGYRWRGYRYFPQHRRHHDDDDDDDD